MQFIILRSLLMYWLIVFCIRFRSGSWSFFQLNSSYFNIEKNIFSKLELDRYIPDRWRLSQMIDDGQCKPRFPVFVKPE